MVQSDRYLGKYLPIIRNSPVYPIIYDREDRVLSFPPIINSEHSKITLNTRNIFIDLTATDQTKLNIVTNMIATMFSEYCEKPFVCVPCHHRSVLPDRNVPSSIEPVKIIYPDGRVVISPDLSWRHTQAHASYVNSCTGLNLSATQVKDLLERMSLHTELAPGDPDTLDVSIPPTRPDILHECDILEDAAIAYGFNNLPDIFPATSTVAQPLAVSKLSDLIRHEWAYAGWVEVLPFILVRRISPLFMHSQPASAAKRPFLNLTFLLLPTVLSRRKLCLAQRGRRRPDGGQDREPQDARVPGGSHVAPAGPTEDDTGEPVARAADSHL